MKLQRNRGNPTLLPLQGGGWEGDGVGVERFNAANKPHPHPNPRLEGEGVFFVFSMVKKDLTFRSGLMKKKLHLAVLLTLVAPAVLAVDGKEAAAVKAPQA